MNSALQRAHAQLAERGLTEDTVQPDLSAAQRQLLDQYVEAFWRKDVDTIVSLLTAEAVWEMPPFTSWFQGRGSIAWLIGNECPGGSNDMPMLQTGRRVRLQFEGWPALQFSGWPSIAVGTFGGNSIIPGPFDVLPRFVTLMASGDWVNPLLESVSLLALYEAVERGLRRREAAGHEVASMTPVCTMMVGRLDDWMKVLVERDAIAVHPDATNWAGVAAFKRAYAIYRERGYRTRALAAAYRHRLHWTEFVGGDVILTMPHAWQARFNESGIDPVERMELPVDPAIVAELEARIPDFRRAYEPDGMTVEEFDTYGATARTLRGFVKAYHDLVATVNDIVMPNPDVKR